MFYPEASNTVVFVIMVDRADDPAGRPVRQGALNGDCQRTAHRAAQRVARTVADRDRGAWLALLVVAPFVGIYPVFLMKALCFALFACAFNLLLGYAACCRSATRVPRQRRLRHRACAAKALGLAARARRSSPARWRRARCSASSSALLAIRRQGIYFAMITLALAQMVYFFCLQAPFTGGEDGIQGVPRGKLFGLIDLDNDLDDVLRRAGDLRRRRSCSSTASSIRRSARC